MNVLERIVLFFDIQLQIDSCELFIEVVGVNGVRYLVMILLGVNWFLIIVMWLMIVGLVVYIKGIYMFCFIELLEVCIDVFD